MLVPVFITSPIFVCLSSIIRAPIFCLDNEYSASTISSIVLLNISSDTFMLFLGKNLNFVLPICSRPALSSGWNIINAAIKPKSRAFINIQFSVCNFNISLILCTY